MSSKTQQEHERRVAKARAWIEAAPTPEERQARKREMYVALWSCPLKTEEYFKMVEVSIEEAGIMVKNFRKKYKTATQWKAAQDASYAELELRAAAALPARRYVDGKLMTAEELRTIDGHAKKRAVNKQEK